MQPQTAYQTTAPVPAMQDAINCEKQLACQVEIAVRLVGYEQMMRAEMRHCGAPCTKDERMLFAFIGSSFMTTTRKSQ